MRSATLRKSTSDLTRRRARTVFSVLTLSIAVASISFFAIPTLIDRAMQDEVRDGRLADVTISMRPVELSDADLAALAAVPNVADLDARSRVDVRVLVGERRAPARVIGVRDFDHQVVDVARTESGSFPGPDELLSDVQNDNVGLYDGEAGDQLTVLDPDGGDRTFTVSGRGRTLPGGEQVQDENVIVLYAPAATVAELSGHRGFAELALHLEDPTTADATIAAVRDRLEGVAGFSGFDDLPSVRAPGDWPAKSDTEQFARLLGVITLLALLSAAVLISNTIGTLVAEQAREIAVMRAIGARRRQVALTYLRTTFLLGVLGAVAGSALGVLLAYALSRSFAAGFWAVSVPFGVDLRVVLISLAIGLVAPPLAALPAIRRAVRLDLREALEASGSALGQEGALDRALRRAGFLPRVAQIGLRNVGRRKRRALATALIVALAVGNLLAVMAISASAADATRRSWSDHREDVQIATAGDVLFDEAAADAIRATPGVAEAQPVLKNRVEVDGRDAFLWGVDVDPLLRYRLADGRWFGPDEQGPDDRLVVVERNIAGSLGIDVGDDITVATAAGDVDLRVIGTVTNQQENGTALYVPLAAAQAVLDQPNGASAYWIRTDSSDPTAVDRTTSALEDRLATLGYDVTTEVVHVAERKEVSANEALTTPIAVLGFLIVAMSMVGLANAITTNVLERTREIGILRSLGARARDIRRIFTTEGVTIAVIGWLLGVPIGYLLHRLLVRFVWELVEVRLPVRYPPWNPVIALAGTVALALVVLYLPVRRAVTYRPGDAIRHT